MGAEAWLSQWYKINVYHARLAVMANAMLLIVAVAVAGLLYVPQILGTAAYSAYVVLGVVLFGGVGGIMSALGKQEPLTQGSPAFYVERESLILRPTIGAAAGLVVFFAQLCGIVTVGSNASPTAAFFVAAFCAGISERFFIKRLEPVLGSGGGSKANKGAP